MTRKLQWSNAEWSNPVSEESDNIIRLRPNQVTSITNVLWLNARGVSTLGVSDVVTTGQGCSQWTDRSSQGAHFLQGTDDARPIVGTSGGHPCVSTDDNRFMSTAHIAAHKIETGNYFYVFSAFRSLENRAGRGLIGRYQTQAEWGLNVTAAGLTDRGAWVVGGASLTNGTLAPNNGELRISVGAYYPLISTPLPGQLHGIFGSDGRGDFNIGSSLAPPTTGTNPTFLGRYSTAGGPGVADHHEHIIFKGNTRMSRRDFNGVIEGMLWEWR